MACFTLIRPKISESSLTLFFNSLKSSWLSLQRCPESNHLSPPPATSMVWANSISPDEPISLLTDLSFHLYFWRSILNTATAFITSVGSCHADPSVVLHVIKNNSQSSKESLVSSTVSCLTPLSLHPLSSSSSGLHVDPGPSIEPPRCRGVSSAWKVLSDIFVANYISPFKFCSTCLLLRLHLTFLCNTVTCSPPHSNSNPPHSSLLLFHSTFNAMHLHCV